MLLIAYLLLIVLGSLHSLEAWQSLRVWSLEFIIAPWPRYVTRTDISTNFLVYVPLGYLLALELAQPRHRGRGVLLASLLSMAFSLAMESLQQLSPGRIASNLDVLLNTLGACTGALLCLHHHRWLRAGRVILRWRRDWFRPTLGIDLGLWLLLLWGLAQFSLLPMPGVGWLGLHLRPFDTPPAGIAQLNFPWFAALFLEMVALGTYCATLLKPGRYVSAMLLLFLLAFAVKLLAATTLLRLRAAGGVLSLETLAAFLLAFWFLLYPWVSRKRLAAAACLLSMVLAVRLVLADYLLLPRVSLLNIHGLAKAVASLWPYLALLQVLLQVRRRFLSKSVARRMPP